MCWHWSIRSDMERTEPMLLENLETPALLLDAPKMNANIARMRERMRSFDVSFRPHVKTSKCVDVALRQFEGVPGPVTVSTLKEAETFLGHGFTDILYAVGITSGKLAHVADLRRRGAALRFSVDSV